MEKMEKAKSIFYQKLAKAELAANLDFQEPDLDFMMFIDEFQKDDERNDKDQELKESNELLTGYIRPPAQLEDQSIYSRVSSEVVPQQRGSNVSSELEESIHSFVSSELAANARQVQAQQDDARDISRRIELQQQMAFLRRRFEWQNNNGQM